MNKQTNQASRHRTIRANRTLAKLLTITVVTLLCVTSASHAQISVGATGSTVEQFNTLPPATSWSHFNITGASGVPEDDAGLDGMVQPVAASSITAQVASIIGNPPGTSANAQWSSDGLYLQTRPTGNAATLLMATLRNTSGSILTALTIDYDYVQRLGSGVAVELIPGNRIYYSLSGAANSWVPIGNFGTRDPANTPQPQSILVDLTGTPWTANSTMYVLFADDNSSPNTDAANGIDNFSVGPPLPIVITQQPTNTTVVENRPVTLTVAVTGTAPQFQWFKDSVPITDATNRTYTIANATLPDTGDYTVVITGRLSVANSSVARLTVVADLTGPLLLSVKGDDTYTKVFLRWNEGMNPNPAEEEGSYVLNGPGIAAPGISPANATLVNGSNVVLTFTDPLQEGATYSLEIDYQTDVAVNPTVKVGNPVNDANGVVTSFRSFVTTRGFTRFQAFLNRPSAETLATFVTLPEYPDASSFDFYTNILYWPQTAPNVEQYVMRFTGLFVAPETGIHQFDPAHDDEMRLRVYPGEDPSGTPTETVAVCCTALTGGPTLDVALVAGQRYYYELLVREFGGGDYAGIGVTLPSGAASSPLLGVAGTYLQVASDPAATLNPVIAQQPQNQIVQVNHVGTLSVVVTNAGGGAAYQWQLNTGNGFNDVTNGNASSYTTPFLTLADNGDMYRVLVTVPGRSLTSSVVTVSVVDDMTAPRITSVAGGGSTITIFFDEVMDTAAIGEVGNYDLKDSANTALALSSPVIAADNRSVSFTTPAQTLGELYTLHAENVPDAAGNPLVAADIVFRSGRGFALFQAYDTGAGNTVAILTSHPSYPNSPRDTSLIPTFDSRNAYPDDSHEGYGGRISGWYVPPATANYLFYLRSDDASELWLSTDNTTANRVMIQTETGCCNAYSAHPSTAKSLVGGQAYFIEVLWKEGTGGDFGQVAVKRQDDPTNPDTLTPISGAFLSAADPTIGGGSTPQITARRSGNNLVITWPGSFTTFILETAPTIPSTTWTPVSSTVVGGENTATIPIPASGNAFYRLRQ